MKKILILGKHFLFATALCAGLTLSVSCGDDDDELQKQETTDNDNNNSDNNNSDNSGDNSNEKPDDNDQNKEENSTLPNLKEVANSIKVSGVLKSEDIIKGGEAKDVATVNFNEVTVSDINHSNVVGQDGTIDFSTLADFVKNSEEAGLSVYGPALSQTTNQNIEYLNSILQGTTTYETEYITKTFPTEEDFYYTTTTEYNKSLIDSNGDCEDMTNSIAFASKEYPSVDIVDCRFAEGMGKDGGNCLVITAPQKVELDWESQFWIKFTDALSEGSKLHIEFDYKASLPSTVQTQQHSEPGWYIHWSGVGSIDFTQEWQHFSKDLEVSADQAGDGRFQSLSFNLSNADYDVTYYIDNVVATADVVNITTEHINTNQVNNGDADNSQLADVTTQYVKNSGDINPSMAVATDGGVDGSKCFIVKNGVRQEVDWESQFWIGSRNPIQEGKSFTVKFDYKASKNVSGVSTQTHGTPGTYFVWYAIGNIDFTTEWQSFEKTVDVTADMDGMESIAFNLSVEGADNVDYYFDNISLVCNDIEVREGTIEVPITNAIYTPLSDEQMKKNVEDQLSKYIANMMTATAGKVSAFDAVVDPETTGNIPETSFDYAKYLGADYVNYVTTFAQLYFKGDKSALQLFLGVNNALKADVLNAQIANIANYTGITGINAYITIDTETSTEEIDAMLATLKATGKAVKITINGLSYNGDNATIDELGKTDTKIVATTINYLTKKYISTIDSNNQYGITFDKINSTLWNSKYEISEIYKGFVLGLQDQEFED